MRNMLRATLLATAIAVVAIGPFVMSSAAQAQGYLRATFGSFHQQLARYGDWVYSDRWGVVWIPADVDDDFHPYGTAGRWVHTVDYGWVWQSDYAWGDIPFHFGRWVNDPYDGWLWIPGYVWSPGWVVWRSNVQYVGWMPMPPDERFLRGDESSIGLSIRGNGFSIRFGRDRDYYGYSRWYGRDYDERRFAANWYFVGTRHLADRDYRPNVVNQTNVVTIINRTTNVTNYTVVNNYVVNKSVDVQRVERASGQRVAAVKATDVVKDPALVTRVDEGRQAQVQERRQIQRGTGLANSAPKPSPEVVSTLSTRNVERHGRSPEHLFTQKTISKAPLAPQTGTPPAGPAPGENGRQLPGQQPGTNGPANNLSPAPPTTPQTEAPKDTGPNKPDNENPDRRKPGKGDVQSPPPAPGLAPSPPESNAPADAKDRGRNKSNGGNDKPVDNNGVSQEPNSPGLSQPPDNNPPKDRQGRNRDKNNVGPNKEDGNTPPAKTPELAQPPKNEAPAEGKGRAHDRPNGGQDNQGDKSNAPPKKPPPPSAADCKKDPKKKCPDEGEENKDEKPNQDNPQ